MPPNELNVGYKYSHRTNQTVKNVCFYFKLGLGQFGDFWCHFFVVSLTQYVTEMSFIVQDQKTSERCSGFCRNTDQALIQHHQWKSCHLSLPFISICKCSCLSIEEDCMVRKKQIKTRCFGPCITILAVKVCIFQSTRGGGSYSSSLWFGHRLYSYPFSFHSTKWMLWSGMLVANTSPESLSPSRPLSQEVTPARKLDPRLDFL